MTVNPVLQLVLDTVDVWAALMSRRKPPVEALKACKIISHRGEHDNERVQENTLEAFRIARDAGAWGIETDIRWTRDLVPMVHHDPDTSRVFGKPLTISKTDFKSLREQVPQVPTFEELVAEFGGRVHLMIEIKAETFPCLEDQKAVLRKILERLNPAEDYHFLALDPALFDAFDIQPRQACLPVALTNIKDLSKVALERGYAGISGHFLLITRKMQDRHKAGGQKIGPGFPASRNALYREVNRGADWIFTNEAVKLLDIINKA
ncbi:MAG: glycerophosphodiester phosphodiesterase [Pseudomonadota bacterium]